MDGAKDTTKAKKKTAAPAAPKPADDAPLLTLRNWGIIGVALIGGVIAWKLVGSTYGSDIETICNAEKTSGVTVEKDMAKVTQWVRAHLATPEGNEFFTSLGDLRVADRAKRLQAEAASAHLGSCPMVASYEQLAAEGDYRSDLQHLCSNAAFPHLAELDDDARLGRLEDWIAAQARSPRTKDLADPLRQANTGADRAKVLRDAAGKMDVFSCDAAKTLESPQAASPASSGAGVRVEATPQIVGPLKEEEVAKAIALVTPALDDCYEKALAKTPTAAGKLAVKVEVDPDGKVTKAAPVQVTVDDREAVACILDGLRAMKLPTNAGPLASVLVPLELSPGPASPPASSAPSATPAVSGKK